MQKNDIVRVVRRDVETSLTEKSRKLGRKKKKKILIVRPTSVQGRKERKGKEKRKGISHCKLEIQVFSKWYNGSIRFIYFINK